MESDIKLLESWWTRRDAEAFNEIVTRYSGLVYAACVRVLGNASAAEDVTQECFVRLAERPVDIRVSFGGWLHRVATRRALDAQRSESRRRLREKHYVDASDSSASPEDLPWLEIRALVDEAIDGLPDDQRVVIVAHFLERRTHQAIAETLGISRRTVINRIQKGIEQTRRHLAKRGVAVTETLLATLLGSRLAEAAPVGLASELGRIALAGSAGKGVAVTTSVVGATILVKNTLIGVGLLIVAVLAAWVYTNRPRPAEPPGDSATTAIEQPQNAEPESPSDISVAPDVPLAETLPAPLKSVDSEVDKDEPVFEGAVVEGIVRNQYGTPIPGAAIHIAERPTQDDVLGNEPVTHTGNDGRFRATGVNPEVHAVLADHPDYAPGWVGMDPSLDKAVQVEILLTQGGAIEGIVSSGGIPQANAHLSAWLDASGHSTLTDAEGRYRLPRVPSGEWVVGLILKDTDGVQREARQAVLVSNGMTTLVDFNLSPPVTELTGTITLRGEAVEGGYVDLLVSTPQGFKEERRVPLNDQGSYVFLRTPEGPAQLAVTAITREHKPYFRTATFDLLGGATNVRDMDIVPGTCVITGVVRLEEPARNGSVLLLDGEFDASELSRDTLMHIDSQKVAKPSEPDKPYRFDELEPGTYTLLAFIYPNVADMSNTVDPLNKALIDLQTVILTDGEAKVIDLYPAPVQ